jgi:hypothetical protein
MRQRVTKDLYAYWDGLRGARSAPDRSDINPAAIRHVLADTFIIEIDRECAFPIRLCGTRINALWLGDQKGRSFVDLWRASDQRAVAAAILTVIDGVSPIVAGVCARAPDAPEIDLELLLLPLRHFGKTHSRVMGSLAPAYQTGWFGKLAANPLELNSLRVIADADRRSITLSPPMRFRTPSSVARSAPKFMVYEGGKAPRSCSKNEM